MALRGRMRWRRELSAELGLGADGIHSLRCGQSCQLPG
jgi:hypothetical protein